MKGKDLSDLLYPLVKRPGTPKYLVAYKGAVDAQYSVYNTFVDQLPLLSVQPFYYLFIII